MVLKRDVLSADGINSYLNEKIFDIFVSEETDSTNNAAKKLAEAGAKEGLVIIAKKQTGGRGRMGRTFHSPEDTGIYMSILLRPDFPPLQTLFITCAAAVSVCRSLEEISGRSFGIKWVNDIFSENKKLCGILTEAAFSENGEKLCYAVLGIGINVYEPEGGFSPDIENIAGALFTSDEEKKDIKNKITAGVLKNFWHFYKNLEKKEFLEEYKKRSVLSGSKIVVIKGENKKSATALGIDDECRLIVKYENGETEALFSGEVSIRKQTGKS